MFSRTPIVCSLHFRSADVTSIHRIASLPNISKLRLTHESTSSLHYSALFFCNITTFHVSKNAYGVLVSVNYSSFSKEGKCNIVGGFWWSIFSHFLKLNYFALLLLYASDLVHDMETIQGLCKLLKASEKSISETLI